jgi:2-succinyl-5-enolpyruvyl-6-hydroxy-3-cyclohexene-1-carboxylate synthase
VAAAGDGAVLGLVGDLAFFHDVSSLLRPVAATGRRTSTSCTLLVLDNGGGGIFSFLPQASLLRPERFETLFGTPQAASVTDVAAGFGVPVVEAASPAALREALDGCVGRHEVAVIRAVVPDRVDNVARHDRIHAAVAAATTAVLDARALPQS